MRRPRGDATGDPSGQGRSGASKTIDASANATTRNRFDQPKIAAALAAFAKFKARTYGVAFYFLPIRTSVGRCDGSEIDFRESRACFVCLFVCFAAVSLVEILWGRAFLNYFLMKRQWRRLDIV